ncbi:recombination protein RecR [Sneathiella sp. CAU 1612]|jgi:recombination protein RecR|uniref:Recombination protein RecR n=1 Tax=Sneathiella sedimenti TaxID=2816034 RepID=A0ABS3F348_9PROT|nr:recombination mediator RecR [Sneathiella sedimenti]MBO0332352.1 recombination protein RecR [Sneathiella sedimenti]
MSQSEIDRLIQLLSKLPGLGPRSARRATLYLISRRESLLTPLSAAMQAAADNVKVCSQCGNLDVTDPCEICRDVKRDQTLLCIVEDVSDLWALERSEAFHGRYHVLGGTLSALDGIGPDELNIEPLIRRVEEGGITEVILALNATIDGQTTSHYLSDRLSDFGVQVTRLAHGVPVGGELDYLDDGTLSAALKSRRSMA